MSITLSNFDIRASSSVNSDTLDHSTGKPKTLRNSSFEFFEKLKNISRVRRAWGDSRSSSSTSLSSLSTSSPPSYRGRRGSRTPSLISRTPSYEIDDPIVYINAVTFDGGGVRGVASAKIVGILMDDLSKATGVEVQAPDYFDMFGGTSTGGLIAIMLGRLRVTTETLLATYSELSNRLFRSKIKLLRGIVNGCKYSGKLAERLFEKICRDNSPDGADTLLRSNEFGAPDVFVAAVDAADASGHSLVIRSYDIDGETTYPHRISDAARATTAAPSYFPAKTLGDGRVALDGGLAANNPTDLLIAEARRRHGLGVRFGLLLSIGTGEKAPVAMPACSSAASILSFTKAVSHILTDSEKVHMRVEERFRESNLGTYLRINVPAIGDIQLDDYKSIPHILEETEAYMNTPEMKEIRRQVVEVLLRSRCQL